MTRSHSEAGQAGPTAAHSLERRLAQAEAELEAVRTALAREREANALLAGDLRAQEKHQAAAAAHQGLLEQQAANLASLYVASHRLHEGVAHAQVLEAVIEIVANMIGSEEVAVVEPEGAGWRVTAAFGDTWRPGERVTDAAPPAVWAALDKGALTVNSGSGPLTAAVPFRVGDRVSGALLIGRLLPQKVALEALDHELLDLLGSQGAVALHLTRGLAGEGA